MVLPIVLLIVAVATGTVLLKTPPELAKSDAPTVAAVVGVSPLEPENSPATIEAFGTVVAAREIEVQPEVTGCVVRHHPQLAPGGVVRAGDMLLEIDRSDYEIAVREAEAALEVARLQVESLRAGVEALRGRATQLEAELSYLRWNMERVASLSEQARANEAEARDTQAKHAGKQAELRALRAQVVEQERNVDRAVAQAEVAKTRLAVAELDLTRTRVTVPFDAIVRWESIEPGQLVSRGSPVARLAATEEFWVEASVPVRHLARIRFPETSGEGGSAVEVTLETGGAVVQRQGMALRPRSALDPAGRMARVLMTIPDPLRLNDADAIGGDAILLGSYVRLSIDAGVLEDVYAIPRYALRENESVWVRTSAGTLAIRDVDVVWRRDHDVLVRDGFEPEDMLVTTHLASVIPGMPLEIRDGGEVEAATPSAGTP